MDKKNLTKAIVSLAVLTVLLLGAYYISSRYSKNNDYASPDTSMGTGSNDNTDRDLPLAKDFELVDLEGNTVKLSDYRGKIVFLNFWATWCGPCLKEMPEFNEASKDFENNGDAILLAVNLTTGGARGETEDKVRKFMNSNGYTMKVLLDKTGKVADQYKIYAIPTTYVIDKDGRIYTYYEGTINKNVLMNVYNELREQG
ncbi:TlpA disulfide reductase family protein [Acetivibrio clariflavus]|uniref:Peroxiredoxin n=1 Tax=Acetivibrio clariflavus (strain DSM 19732 / NBRC 101661 / EBR45) TaxID=720554 RepID=G8LTW8_ACECE|nr:TlpA disulfide reductase family protein [Acetivibrio clariflavus]AEV67314.1 Peroxiredoxin [Acetivibrio clariflavus DSM 19732]HOQ00601.1 TlpA disulfide reductase family protein [Acetivibrio clariflavus]HPU63461.1 TlpA disulfide reductase family protein [Mobilitalea sp.]